MKSPVMLMCALFTTLVLLGSGCALRPVEEEKAALGENMVAQAYPGMPAALVARTQEDESQRICSTMRREPLNADEAARVIGLARTSIRYPASGKLFGNWKAGEKLAYESAGQRIVNGNVEKRKENGGGCSNCHVLDSREVNAGNLGPALTGYGVRHGHDADAVKYTYEKIYNAWAVYPCSNMPRFGANGYLTPEQVADLVAYLVDPQSPVNNK